MADVKQFKLPDVGEGLTEAEIVSWKVKPGDTIKINEIIVEIETAKSLVELPSPFAGVVGDLLVDEGNTVDVGTPIITVDVGGPGGAAVPSRRSRHRSPSRRTAVRRARSPTRALSRRRRTTRRSSPVSSAGLRPVAAPRCWSATARVRRRRSAVPARMPVPVRVRRRRQPRSRPCRPR